MKRAFFVSGIIICSILSIAAFLQASGIVPAIVPSAVPSANRRGTVTGCGGSGCFQLASSAAAGSSGAAYCDDGSGNLTTSGCTTNAVTSTSPVTVNANSTADQQLMELSLSAGYLNSLGRPFDFFGAGVYTTQAGQTPTLEFKIKLCTVSGCGSGTVVSLVDITTTATTANSPNVSWNLRAVGTTNATGATGNLEMHGNLTADLGNLISASDTIFTDTNTAVSSNIDLTAALFVDFTIKFSTQPGTPFNAATQREGVVSPGGTTSGGGSGAITQLSKITTSAQNNCTFSSIGATNNTLWITFQGRSATAANTDNLDIQFNADTGTNYSRQFLAVQGTNNVTSGTQTGVVSILSLVMPAANATASNAGDAQLFIPNYAGTTFFKNVEITLNPTPPFTGSPFGEFAIAGTWNNTAAITSIKLFTDSGANFVNNSVCILYGVN